MNEIKIAQSLTIVILLVIYQYLYRSNVRLLKRVAYKIAVLILVGIFSYAVDILKISKFSLDINMLLLVLTGLEIIDCAYETREKKDEKKAIRNTPIQMMLGPKGPNYDAYGLFRALHSHNPAQYSHIVGYISHFYAHIGAGPKAFHPPMSKLMWV